MNAISKINKQSEQTWINLQRRLNEIQFQYDTLFNSPEVYQFVNDKALSVGSCLGYFVPSLITTSAFLLASSDVRVQTTTHKQCLNLYTMFVGYPGTGKSSAIQHVAQDPFDYIDISSATLSKATSAGLVKNLSKQKKAMILSPEIFDIINKLLKSDEDNGTGDVQLLCKLFSGEKCSYHYSTENPRIIDTNTPFCILGSTQLINAAKLIARIDQGHGLVDRFLITVPLSLRPTISQMVTAQNSLAEYTTQDFNALVERIIDIDTSTTFKFDSNASQFLREHLDLFVNEVNEAINEGRVPPKSKTTELVPRVATALHVLNHHLQDILDGDAPTPVPTTIPLDTLTKAAKYVQFMESQKEILCQFLKDLTSMSCDKTIVQPSLDNIQETILQSPGPVTSYRSFKHGKRSSRSISQDEYMKATTSLQQHGFGRVIEFSLPRVRTPCKVFIKSQPTPWPNTPLDITIDQLQSAISKPIHKDISQQMQQYLKDNGHL